MPPKRAVKKGKTDQRRGLLAAVHIGKTRLDLEEDTYRDLLKEEFDVDSARDLTIGQLKRLLSIFGAWGFQRPDAKQVAALRERAREIAARLHQGEVRLQGLTQKICGVANLKWCHDVGKLENLLAALGKIERDYPVRDVDQN